KRVRRDTLAISRACAFRSFQALRPVRGFTLILNFGLFTAFAISILPIYTSTPITAGPPIGATHRTHLHFFGCRIFGVVSEISSAQLIIVAAGGVALWMELSGMVPDSCAFVGSSV